MNKYSVYTRSAVAIVWWSVVGATMAFLVMKLARAVISTSMMALNYLPQLSVSSQGERILFAGSALVCCALFGYSVMRLFEIIAQLVEAKRRG